MKSAILIPVIVIPSLHKIVFQTQTTKIPIPIFHLTLQMKNRPLQIKLKKMSQNADLSTTRHFSSSMFQKRILLGSRDFNVDGNKSRKSLLNSRFLEITIHSWKNLLNLRTQALIIRSPSAPQIRHHHFDQTKSLVQSQKKSALNLLLLLLLQEKKIQQN